MDTKNEILEILGDYIDIPATGIDTSENLKLSAGLDSFVLLSFIGAIEDRFRISIPNDSFVNMNKLDDIIAYVDVHRA